MSIPVFILKRFTNFFSFWISKLINLCFETGIFPDILKIAKVIPLHKKESKLKFLNYRPISLLSVIIFFFLHLCHKGGSSDKLSGPLYLMSDNLS